MDGQRANEAAPGALAVPSDGAPETEMLSRRRMLVLGLGAAWAVPTIATLRPSPALAVSPPPNGNGNGTNGTNGRPPETPEEEPRPEPPEEDVRDEVVEDDDPPVEVEDDEVAEAEDPEDGTPEPSPSPSPSPEAEDETGVAAATEQPLAATGANLGWLAAAGGAAMAGGAAALRSSRRARTDEPGEAQGSERPVEDLD